MLHSMHDVRPFCPSLACTRLFTARLYWFLRFTSVRFGSGLTVTVPAHIDSHFEVAVTTPTTTNLPQLPSRVLLVALGPSHPIARIMADLAEKTTRCGPPSLVWT